jgi:uncharacterized membrane protein
MAGPLAIAYVAFAIVTGLVFLVVGLPYLLVSTATPAQKSQGLARVLFGVGCIAASALGRFIPDAIQAVQTADADAWSIVQIACVAIMTVCIVINLVLLTQQSRRR